MILHALTKLYSDLLERSAISRPGWCMAKIGYALCIDEKGTLLQIIPLVREVENKGKTVFVNQTLQVPAQVKRSSGVAPNFLCDTSSYMLGADDKGNAKRTVACFEACRDLHLSVLKDIDSSAAKAVVQFFCRWNPTTADSDPVFSEVKEELMKGANLVFRVNGRYAHEDEKIADAWDRYYGNDTDLVKVRCLISGELDALAVIHPSLKGVDGAQSSGAALVSFNAPAFCSFDREQGENAPIGKKAAFAYTTALNYLLADREHVQHIGDTTVVCWADGAKQQYRDLALSALFGSSTPQSMSEDDLRAAVKRLSEGQPCAELDLAPETPFYILGLSPNAARLSVRFFFRNSFGELMKNVNAHHERMRITGLSREYIPLWMLLRATVNQNAKDKSPSPVLAGAVTRAILGGQRYPGALMEAAMLRIRAERNITPERAAIIKAYYMKNEDVRCPKEVLTVSLNENSKNIPYTIGRLFALYEAVQESANPGVNATIRDKYFNSASATPAQIMPILNDLYRHHLRKLDPRLQVYYEKQVGMLMEVLDAELPARLSLPEQGAFQLGYYHQKQKRFEKKGE